MSLLPVFDACVRALPLTLCFCSFSMYRPSAVILAQTIADLPVLFVQLAIFCIIVYFMCGLKETAGSFFIFYLFVYFTTLSTMAFFRFIGSCFATFEGASKVSGFMFSVLVTYGELWHLKILPLKLTSSTPRCSRLHHPNSVDAPLVRLAALAGSNLLLVRGTHVQ